jgi:hypothetical protein
MSELNRLFSAPNHAPEGSPLIRSPKRPWSAPLVILAADLQSTSKSFHVNPTGDLHFNDSVHVS